MPLLGYEKLTSQSCRTWLVFKPSDDNTKSADRHGNLTVFRRGNQPDGFPDNSRESQESRSKPVVLD
jgi:hypothetical protein